MQNFHTFLNHERSHQTSPMTGTLFLNIIRKQAQIPSLFSPQNYPIFPFDPCSYPSFADKYLFSKKYRLTVELQRIKTFESQTEQTRTTQKVDPLALNPRPTVPKAAPKQTSQRRIKNFQNKYNNCQGHRNRMDSRFTFNGMDLSTYNNFDANDLPHSPAKQPPQTAADDLMADEEPLHSKPTLPTGTSYEISFQKGFMNEHGTVFQRELQNYMEFVRSFIEEYDRTILRRFPEGLYAVASGMTFEEVLMMSAGEMPEQTKSDFVQEVRGRDKLAEFLNVVADSCPGEVAVELIHVAQQLLLAFQDSPHKENLFVEAGELLELGENAREGLEGVKILDLSILPGSGESQELCRKFDRFMEVFCATTVLVIGQFFENPYSGTGEGVDDLKRPFSPFALEQDEGDGTNPQKKRKFSF